MASRFACVTDEGVNNLVKDKNSPNTHKATDVAWRMFECYLKDKSLSVDIASVSLQELNAILRKFYVELRKCDGTLYKKTAFNSVRAGVQRRIKELRPEIDIIIDKEFQQANEVFKAQCVYLKKEGMAKVTHKPPISLEDMRTLYSSPVFSVEKPVSLQRKFFFDIMLYFCRRGQENLRNMKVSDFQVKTDALGRQYVEKVGDELTKNRRESNEAEEGGIISETGSSTCPVAAFKLYVAHLNPKVDCFFQRPKSFTPKFGPWYDAQVLGLNYLGNMMKRISIEAKLSTLYTNHSIRATSVTILDESGVEARHIMAVSGHRSESSIRSYARTSIGMKRKMSENLSAYCEDPEFRNFDFGINFLEDIGETSGKKTLPVGLRQEVPLVQSQEIHKNNTTEFSLSSFIGSAAHYVEFSNCTFNFNKAE